MAPQKHARLIRLMAAVMVGIAIGGIVRWVANRPPSTHTNERVAEQTLIDIPTSISGPTTLPGPREPWNEFVPHLFFHPLVTDVAAFHKGKIGKGFLDYFVTVDEFKRILDQLYARNFALVDLHAAVSGQLTVPVGKRPVVMSIDDLNYYAYLQQAGLPNRLVIDTDGRLVSEYKDGRRDRQADAISILDDFVLAHPDFSIDGSKATLNVTGYEGVFGYATNWNHGIAPAADQVAKAIEVANELKATGWTFASHSYGHITIPERSVERIRQDTTRWADEVAPIVGPTDVFVYPYGASVPMTSARAGTLRSAGFRIFCDIGGEDLTIVADQWTLMSRHHIDGIGFRDQADSLKTFFDVDTVIDKAARA
jgi:Polysaccharide deacetylase